MPPAAPPACPRESGGSPRTAILPASHIAPHASPRPCLPYPEQRRQPRIEGRRLLPASSAQAPSIRRFAATQDEGWGCAGGRLSSPPYPEWRRQPRIEGRRLPPESHPFGGLGMRVGGARAAGFHLPLIPSSGASRVSRDGAGGASLRRAQDRLRRQARTGSFDTRFAATQDEGWGCAGGRPHPPLALAVAGLLYGPSRRRVISSRNSRHRRAKGRARPRSVSRAYWGRSISTKPPPTPTSAPDSRCWAIGRRQPRASPCPATASSSRKV